MATAGAICEEPCSQILSCSAEEFMRILRALHRNNKRPHCKNVHVSTGSAAPMGITNWRHGEHSQESVTPADQITPALCVPRDLQL